jgi:hypothetical protein
MPDLEETTPGSGIYDHWSGGSSFSYWWEFLSAWGILPGSANPRTITLRVGGINFPVEIYEYDEDTTLSGSIGTSTNDNNGVVVICHGKLTLSNVTTAARKRGLFIWGDEVVGSANMTQKGAHASGQNLYLCSGRTVTATGGLGGSRAYAYRAQGASESYVAVAPVTGGTPSLGCGGGYSGVAVAEKASKPFDPDTGGSVKAYSGAGGNGTSYCGGSGGGGVAVWNYSPGTTFTGTGDSAGNNGSTPGTSKNVKSDASDRYWDDHKGSDKGGGTLIITGKSVSGTFTSRGESVSYDLYGWPYPGSSGGGCVAVLANSPGSISISTGNGSSIIQEV